MLQHMYVLFNFIHTDTHALVLSQNSMKEFSVKFMYSNRVHFVVIFAATYASRLIVGCTTCLSIQVQSF